MGLLFFNHWAAAWFGDWKTVFDQAASALIVVAVLGLTIEWLFRQKLQENVFKATLGYLLPDELRPELRWIYEQTVVAVSHEQRVILEPISAQAVLMHISVTRTLRNISGVSSTFPLGVAIDDWFRPEGQSKIHDIGYSTTNRRWSWTDHNGAYEYTDYSLTSKPENITLGAGEEVTTWLDIEEFKNINDVNYFFYHISTKNPIVKVEAPLDKLGIKVGFAHRADEERQLLARNEYRLEGTLLPHSSIEVRWWDKKMSEKWQANRSVD